MYFIFGKGGEGDDFLIREPLLAYFLEYERGESEQSQ